MILSQLSRFAKRPWARLSTVTNQFFRRLTQPASPNLVTGTLAGLATLHIRANLCHSQLGRGHRLQHNVESPVDGAGGRAK